MPRFSFISIALSLIFFDIVSGPFAQLFASKKRAVQFAKADYFAMVLIDARKLQTSTFQACFKSLSRLQNEHNLFGHAWILLVDQKRGRCCECGFTGEGDVFLPSYTEGLGLLLQGQIKKSMLERGADLRNPASYLFIKRDDGYLQWSNGGHKPNCAAGFALTKCQFDQMVKFLMTQRGKDYCLQRENCVHFVLKLMRLANLFPPCHPQIVHIPKSLRVGSQRVILRRDARFCLLKLSTPLALRRAIKRCFSKGDIDLALQWYHDHSTSSKRFKEGLSTATPIACNPLSTKTTDPVIPCASDERIKAAVSPT